MRTNKRAVGIIVKDGKLLVFRRFKGGQWYYAFAGGGVEEEETEEEAVIREMKEELGINVKINKFLFKQFVSRKPEEESLEHYFYLITEFTGAPQLSGPEKKRSTKDNQYHPTWISLLEIDQYPDLYPTEARNKVIELFCNNDSFKS